MALIPQYDKSSKAWRKILQALLPPGPIWDLDSQPNLAAVADAMVKSLNGAHNAIRLFVLQAFPWTMTYLLDEWVAALDLPWPCEAMPTTAEEKKALIAARIAAHGGQSAQYLVDVAAAYGIPIVITERPFGVPFRAGRSRAGDRLNTVAALFHFLITAPSSTPLDDRIRLECLIAAFKPAHAVPVITYT